MTVGQPELTCFVVMPITTPAHLLDRYGDREDHFVKIYEALLAPAIDKAGLSPMPPSRSGTENIQAAIINDLQGASLVLADLSGLNPNVFLELGIRSALDLPICLVWDGHDRLPFDSGTLNTHKYDPRPVYELNNEINRLAEFIASTMKKSDGRNELWKFFGRASENLPVGELDPEDAAIHSKLDQLLELAAARPWHEAPPARSQPSAAQVEDVVRIVTSGLIAGGDAGMHGSRVRGLCRDILVESYEGFLAGESLSQALGRAGVPIRTDSSGTFFLDEAPRAERVMPPD